MKHTKVNSCEQTMLCMQLITCDVLFLLWRYLTDLKNEMIQLDNALNVFQLQRI